MFMATINTIASLMFLSTTNPIPMITSLITFTISSSMLSCSMINNAWFGYSLTLIMIGGMMIIFIYMTATSPNTKISLSSNTIILLAPITVLVTPSLHSTPQKLSNNPMLELFTSNTTIILASYLLITLSIINKSSTHLDSNMRSTN